MESDIFVQLAVPNIDPKNPPDNPQEHIAKLFCDRFLATEVVDNTCSECNETLPHCRLEHLEVPEGHDIMVQIQLFHEEMFDVGGTDDKGKETLVNDGRGRVGGVEEQHRYSMKSKAVADVTVFETWCQVLAARWSVRM
ncbi:hypothetical protein LTR08_005405 [Meristemomyces frigidus]|nr:hypothetical protein LTR08_005405 [Meristemomyces frigidus]